MITDPKVTSPTLNTPDDVSAWFEALLDAGCNFHPEDTFLDMVDRDSGFPTFRESDARRMDEAMERAYALTGDACEVAVNVFQRREAARA